MPHSQVYLSLVVTARNDDHGGSLLGRMQAFVNSWIGQCRRHGLSAELIVVDWNPPADRPPLIGALNWPPDTQPCDVRFIQVPPEIHRRFRHAEHLPLYQMIAKNVGIRRARGQFILATNIDILFSDELVRFLAQRSLQAGRMYRMDRHDAMSDVPVDGSVDQQLAYCQTHLIRVNTREGTFSLSPEGNRAPGERDIAAPDSGIRFGSGWYAVETHSAGEVFRWVANEAEVLVTVPSGRPALLLELEPGPGVNRQPFLVELVDSAFNPVARTWIRGRCRLELRLPAAVTQFFLRTVNGGMPIADDPRILNFKVNRCTWADVPSQPVARQEKKKSPVAEAQSDRDKQEAASRERQPAGANGFALRSSPISVPRGSAAVQSLRRLVESAGIDPEKPIAVLLPKWVSAASGAYRNDGGASGVVRWTLRNYFRPKHLVAVAEADRDIFDPLSNILPGSGWYDVESFRGERFRWARNDAELVVRQPDMTPACLAMHIEPGPGVNWAPFKLLVRSHGKVIAQAEVRKLQYLDIPLPLQAGRSHLLSLHIEGGDRPCNDDPRTLNFRLFWCGWAGGLSVAGKASRKLLAPDIPRGKGLFLGGGWQPVTDDAGETYFAATDGGEILVQTTEAEPRVLRLELAPESVGSFRLEVRANAGKVIAAGTLEGRQVCYLTLPILPGITEAFALKLLDNPLRIYRLGWADGRVDITDFAAGIGIGAGWGPAFCAGGELCRAITGEAELEITVPGGQRRYLRLELESESGNAESCSVLDATGATIARFSVGSRKAAYVEIPWQPGMRMSVRLAGPGIRAYRCGWSTRAEEAVDGAVHFRCEGVLASPDEDIAGIEIELGAGWHAAERSGDDIFRWVSHQAEVFLSEDRPPRFLKIELEAGPSLESDSFVLQILDRSWRRIGEFPVFGRQEIQVELPEQAGPPNLYRFLVDGGGLPVARDPRILDFRVYRIEGDHAEHANSDESKWLARVVGPGVRSTRTGAVGKLSKAGSDPVGAVHLHTNACGDFTLMARQHWLDLRGYPEFDMYSFHIDSILCYAAHHGGAREEILKEPMRIYHIEHGSGSGWTPEGQAKLFDRLRANGISWIEYPELVTWAAQMRKLDCPIIFNRESWGLAEIELPEMRLGDRQQALTT